METAEGLEIGNKVTFFDAKGKPHKALITANWGGLNETPSLNLVFVTEDETKTDSYGRQIERATSVVHQSNQGAHGMYWEK